MNARSVGTLTPFKLKNPRTAWRRRVPGGWNATFSVILAISVAFLSGCEDPGPGTILTIEATGTVAGQLLFDANGNGAADSGDRPLEGWTFRLAQPAGGTVVSGVTNNEGIVLFEQVPVGRLVPALSEAQLGDTLNPIPGTFPTFTLAAQQEVGVVPVVTLPLFTIAEARDLPTEKPVFVAGIALNSFPTTEERNLHLKSGGSYIRVLSVDSGTVAVGDSVRVRGRTGVSEGVPVLDGKVVYRLGSVTPAPVPVTLTTAEAAGARGGALDAALVGVFDAEILEVTNEGNDGVNMVVDDGGGPLTIHFRAFLGVDPDAIDPDTDRLFRAVGLLVPARIQGALVWKLQPRSLQEVVVVRIGN
jgi:hypothetical protein